MAPRRGRARGQLRPLLLLGPRRGGPGRGGLHGGTVTAGELGDLRRQIVFVGDILNTAARLEEYAKRAGLDLVVSDALLRRLELPPGVLARRCGELDLRGKEAPVAAYSLSG